MKTRIIVAVIAIPLLLVVLLILPPVWLMGMLMAMLGIAAYELLNATGSNVHHRITVFTAAAAMLIPVLVYNGVSGIYYQITLYCLAVVMFIEAVLSYGGAKPLRSADIMYTLFGGIVIPMALTCLLRLKMMPNGKYLVLLPFVCTFVSDSGAYFVGVFLGKHKGIFKVSPNKSLEGCIGSMASLIVGMVIYGLVLRYGAKIDVSFPILMLYAVIGNFVTQLGDLAFSLIKREHGIKDYGNLIPGHGGMLDRFDSMTFAAPAIFILVTLIPAF